MATEHNFKVKKGLDVLGGDINLGDGFAYKIDGTTVVDSSRNLSNIGTIGATSGHITGKFAVKSTGVHASYDFYNNGTTYLNGTTEVNAEFKISSSSSYITHFNYQDNGVNIISQANAGSTSIRNNNGTLFTLSGAGSLSVVGNVIAGNSSTAAILRAHYNDGSYMSLEGFGLVMNRGASYIRPSTDGDKHLYIGAADASLDWASIRFRSTAGLYLNGTQFIDASRNLTNTHDITFDGVARSTNNANVDGPNFNVSTTNKDTAEYAYRVDRSGTVKGGITINGTFKSTTGIDLTEDSAAYLNLNPSAFITFYGNSNSHHAIGSRNESGAASDDLRINTYAALHINLDSNNNNTSSADFTIGKHGGGTGTISNLFTVSGEDGTTTVPYVRITGTGDAALASTTHGLQIGATSGANVIIDDNEVMARNNGAASTLYLQADGGNVYVGGGTAANLVVTGSLTVQGTTTTIDTANLNVEDNNITLNYSTGDSSASANGAGITIQDAVNSTTDATILWSQSGGNFNVSHGWNSLGYLQHSGVLYSRNNLLVLNSAGNGWNTWATRSGGQFNLSVGTIASGAITAVGNNIFGSTAANYDQYIRGSSNVGLRIQTNAQGTTSSDGMRVGLNGVHAFVWQFEALPLAFATSGTERLSIAATGGFDFKSNPLSNIGTISSGAITSTGNITGAALIIDGNTAVDKLSTNYMVFYDGSGNPALYAGNTSDNRNYYQSSHHRFRSDDGGTNFAELSSAGLRIGGVSTPAEKLHVESGNIRADGAYLVSGTTVIDSSRNLTNIGTITNSGKISSSIGSNATYSKPLLEITTSATPTQIKITTNIPYSGSGASTHAHSVTIRGFQYGSAQMADLQIGWHVYNNEFYNRSVTSSGSWAPTVTLAVENNKVVIHLASPGYWPKLYVESMYNAYGGAGQASGWSWSDAAISADSGTPNQTVPYKLDFGDGVFRSAGTTVIDSTSFRGREYIRHNNSGNIVMDMDQDTYTMLKNPLGQTRLWLGSSGYSGASSDTNNYYNGSTHFFRDTGSNESARISGLGVDAKSGGFLINGTSVINSSRNIHNVGTIASGAITSTGNIEGASLETNHTITFGYNSHYLQAGTGSVFFKNSSNASLGGIDASGFNTPYNYQIAGTTVIDSSRNLTNIGTISSGEITATGRSTFDSITIDDDGSGSPLLRVVGDDHSPWLFQLENDSATNDGLFQAYITNDNNLYFRAKETGAYPTWYFQISNGSNHVTSMYLNSSGINGAGHVDVASYKVSTTTVIDSSRNLTNIGTIGSSGQHSITGGSTGSILLKIGSATQTEYVDFQMVSNSGVAEFFKNGTAYTGYGGASSFNMYNSNGLLAFHPGSATNVLQIDSTGLNVGASRTIRMNGTTVIDASRNLTNIGTISSGSIAAQATNIDNAFNFLFTDSVADSSKTGMRIDYNASDNTVLTADRNHIAFEIDYDVTSTGGDTSNEYRAYGISVDIRGSGDTDLRRGVYSYVETQHSAGTVSENVAIYGYAVADDTGTGRTTNNYGGYFLAFENGTGSGGTGNHYGVFSKAQANSLADKDIGSMYGVYSEVEYDTTGATTSISTIYGVRSVIDNDSTDTTVTNSYLFHGSYEGTINATNAYGLYINGNVENYFAGHIRAEQGYRVGSTTVIDSSRNLTNIGTISSGAITAPKITATAAGMSTFSTDVSTNDDWLNSPISIRERGAGASSSNTSDTYAPNLNFHWAPFRSRSIWMRQDGSFNFGEYGAGVGSATSSLSALNADSYKILNTTVIDSSRNLTNIGRITATDNTYQGGIFLSPASGSSYISANRASDTTGQVGFGWYSGGSMKWVNYLDNPNPATNTLYWYAAPTATNVMSLTTGGNLDIGGYFTFSSSNHRWTASSGGAANNILAKIGTTGAAGIAVKDSSNNFKFQLYGDGTNYGFLDGDWAGWDIQKAINGKLYFNGDTTYFLQPEAANSAKFRQFVQIGDSSSYSTNSGSWGARLNVTDDIHAKIEVGQDADGMLSHWYAHTGHTGIKFGTASSHDVEFQRAGSTSLEIEAGGIKAFVPFRRSSHHASGFLEGSYNNVGANGLKTNPIYTIGSSYNPAETSLSNMYGIGYARGDASYLSSFTGAQNWGMYVAADGDARIWLDAQAGQVMSTGGYRVGSTEIVDSSRNLVNIGNITAGQLTVGGNIFNNSNSSYDIGQSNLRFNKLYVQNTIDSKGAFASYGTNTSYGVVRITHPGGADRYTRTASETGAIKIVLPQSWTSTMMRMTIQVYEYNTGRSFTVYCGGYNYSSGSAWINTFAQIISSGNVVRDFNVRFGHDGSKCCIYIGELTSTWSYPQVTVTDFQAGFSAATTENWDNDWDITLEASAFQNVNSTISTADTGRHHSDVFVNGSEVISNGRVLQNVTLKHGGGGARFETNNWHESSEGYDRFYFEASNRTFYRGTGHHFRNNSNVTTLNISGSGGMNVAGGDTNAASDAVLAYAGTTVIDTSRNLTNIGTISSGATTVNGILTVGGTAAGSEGGELRFTFGSSTTLSGSTVNNDLAGNTVRWFESGGNTRGAYIDINACGNNATSKIWHSTNDGSGSGLDADTVDGIHKTGFMQTGRSISGSPNTISNGGDRYEPHSDSPTNTYYAILTYGNGGNVTGQLASHFQTGQSYTRAYNNSWSSWRTQWDSLNDGSGSGLDADLVDGYQSARDAGTADTVAIRNGSGDIWTRLIRSTFGSTNSAPASTARIAFRNDNGTSDNYIRTMTNTAFVSWMNSQSGLDADTLDGQHGSYYYSSANYPPQTNFENVYNNLSTSTGSGADLNTTFQNDRSGFFDVWGGTAGSNNKPPGTTHVQGLQVRHSTSTDYGWQLASQYNQPGKMYLRHVTNGTYYDWHTMWSSQNDGPGSGLNADLLDGYHSGENGTSVNLRTGSNGYLYLDNWLRTGNGTGLYTNDGAYFYRGGAYWISRGNNASVSGTHYQTSDGTTRGYVYSDNSNQIGFLNETGNWRIRVQSAGSVYMGGTQQMRINSSSTTAIVEGSSTHLVFRNTGSGAISFQKSGGTALGEFTNSGNLNVLGNVTAYGSPSDINLKENIETISNAIEKVQKLDGVTFNYKKDGGRSTGLIAQQLQEVLPEVVYTSEGIDGEEHLAVRYGNTVGLLVEAIKELKQEINELKAQLKEK